jgi:hypothetical protein
MPTTTPAAMPAVLGLDSSAGAAAADGVAVGVLTGAAVDCVGFGAADEELSGL